MQRIPSRSRYDLNNAEIIYVLFPAERKPGKCRAMWMRMWLRLKQWGDNV